MNVAVALLTCDRYDYTERVVSALAAHNDLSAVQLFYADDNSRDKRIHELAQGSGYEPVFLNKGRRLGCSPMTEALWNGVRDRVGEDAIMVSLQNDFECVRELPWGLIEKAIQNPGVGCVKLWDRKLGRRIAGPRTRLLRGATWELSQEYDESVEVSRTGWGYGPHATRLRIACSVARRVRRELGMMRQTIRLDKLVVRPQRLSFKHIGRRKTPRAIYRSRKSLADIQNQNRPDWVRIPGFHGLSCMFPQERLSVLESIPATGTVLEIGTLHGTTVASWAEARPGVQFTSVDAFFNLTVGFGAMQNWERNRRPNMTLIRGKIEDVSKDLPRQCYDVVFVDGDHTENACYDDLVIAQSLVSKDGQIIVHDYAKRTCPGVAPAVNRFCKDYSYRVDRREMTLAWLVSLP